jgi:hypothetical protein
MAKPKSRQVRWGEASAKAREALEELEELRTEFEEWRDNLPENLQSSSLGEKLDAVAELDINSLMQELDEIEMIELPLGFGRD